MSYEIIFVSALGRSGRRLYAGIRYQLPERGQSTLVGRTSLDYESVVAIDYYIFVVFVRGQIGHKWRVEQLVDCLFRGVTITTDIFYQV